MQKRTQTTEHGPYRGTKWHCLTERIPWGPGAFAPVAGFPGVATDPLGLRSSAPPREYTRTRA